jgi:hypothetical protein
MISFGHACYFGIGAYAAALAVKHGMSMAGALALAAPVAFAGAVLFGWLCVRLSGVYMAMLTLSFAQITWSVAMQWDDITGGSNGIVGVWPAAWLACRRLLRARDAGRSRHHAACLDGTDAFGYALRAVRDSPLRAGAIGIDARRTQWLAFAWAAGLRASPAGSMHFPRAAFRRDTGDTAFRRRWSWRCSAARALAGPLLGAPFSPGCGHAAARDRILAAILGAAFGSWRVSVRHRRRDDALAHRDLMTARPATLLAVEHCARHRRHRCRRQRFVCGRGR